MPSRKGSPTLAQFLDGVLRAERDLDHFHHIRSILSDTQRRIFLKPLFDTVGELVGLSEALDGAPLEQSQVESFEGARARMLDLQKQVSSLLR